MSAEAAIARECARFAADPRPAADHVRELEDTIEVLLTRSPQAPEPRDPTKLSAS